MRDYNKKLSIIVQNSKILTARHHGAFNGLGGMVYPKTDEEKETIKKLASLKTYFEIKGNKNRFSRFMNQFKG